MLHFRCSACGEVHAVPEFVFHEIAPDGVWARCPITDKYALHKLLSGPGFPKRSARMSKIGRVGERVRGLLGMT